MIERGGRAAHGRAWAACLVALVAGCADAGLEPEGTASCEPAYLPAEHCDAVLALRQPDELPEARGNRYADDEDAALLGFHLFFDRDLGNGFGCPDCHLPELAFTDRKPVSTGVGIGNRNSPTIFNAGRLRVVFWDGRADSMWSQPLFAIENPLEMNSTRLELAHTVGGDEAIRTEYEAVFGSLPDMSSWPEAGMPGQPAFDALPAETQDQVNRIAANVGKAMEAYFRKNVTAAAPLDRYLSGDEAQLTEPARDGLVVFLEHGCANCHSGPMLTDERFHNVGFPSLPGAAPDPGRAEGVTLLRNNIFNLAGPYADPGPGVPAVIEDETGEEGAFRTPSLRNVARTAPYGHDGALATLRDVLSIHAPDMTEEEQGMVIAFLQTLSGDYPERPWSNWPTAQ